MYDTGENSYEDLKVSVVDRNKWNAVKVIFTDKRIVKKSSISRSGKLI